MGTLKHLLFVYLFLALLGLSCCAGFSVVAVSGGCSLFAVHGLLTTLAFLAAERRLWSIQATVAAARRLRSWGSQAPEHSLSSGGLVAPWRVGLNSCLLHWRVNSSPLRNQGSPDLFLIVFCFIFFFLSFPSSYFFSGGWGALLFKLFLF